MLSFTFRAFLSRSNPSFRVSQLLDKRRLQSSVAEALDIIQEGLRTKVAEKSAVGVQQRIFLGTGQYYEHKENERIVVLSLGKDSSPPVVLLDSAIPSQQLDTLEGKISRFPGISLSTGEVDCLNEGAWRFGFERKPDFSIFSASGVCCELKPESNLRLLYDSSVCEEVTFSNIKHVQVSLSAEPWHERKLEIQLKDDELLTVLEDSSPDESGDLGVLMMSTEWLVKAGGHLCLTLHQTGQSVPLLLPNVLRADGNAYVSLRNKAWAATSKV